MKYLSHATFIRQVVLPFKAEYDRFLERDGGDDLFHFGNTLFGPVDAEVLYSVVRTRRPSLVVEIGAGWSSLLIDEALALNDFGFLESYDPSPPGFALAAIRKPAGKAMEAFERLQPGDILFVDGSHIRSPGSDVDLLFSTILPSLPDGVWVHFHDIFLPDPYPDSWSDRGYNEQDHLAAFLDDDPGWSVIFSSHHAQKIMPEVLEETFASYDDSKWPGSFWMRRKA